MFFMEYFMPYTKIVEIYIKKKGDQDRQEKYILNAFFETFTFKLTVQNKMNLFVTL